MFEKIMYSMLYTVQWQFPWITSPQTIAPIEIPLWAIISWTFTPRQLALNNSPWTIAPTKSLPGQLPLRQLPLNNFSSGQPLKLFSSWVVLCLNFTLAKASIATGDHCKPVIRAVAIFYIFFIGAVLQSHEIKMNFFPASCRTHF